MARIVVMTDSTCDLPQSWVRRHDIRIVPTFVNFGTDSLADDGVQLTRTDFYNRIVDAPIHPTTAAPSPGITLEVMHKALAEADHVIAITAPHRLSGIFNTFRMAAEQTAPDRVTLIDSHMLSMGLGWQVWTAAELAAAGASPDKIKQVVTNMQPRILVWAALDTMEYLRRSGRVSWASAIVGDFLKIKPVVQMYRGDVTSAARVRTSTRSFDKLVELAHQAAPLERLAVMHSNYPDGARRLSEALADIHPQGEIPFSDVTPVIGVHVGPHGLGLAIVKKAG